MKYNLHLYITGRSSHSLRALRNLKHVCNDELEGNFELEVIDVLEQPERAEQNKILTTPTLVKCSPAPQRKVVGDLTDCQKLLWALDLRERDPSERKAPVDGESYAALLELNPDGIILVDVEGRVMFVNPAGAQMLEKGAESVRGELFGFPLVDGESTEVNLVGDRIAELRTVATRWEGQLVYIAALRDITGRKRAEEERERLMEALQARTNELARSNAELEQFASIASHDLQEPLRMVASYTTLLAEDYKGKLGTEADEYIYYAVDGTKRMQQLIHDLLALSRVGSRRKPPQPIDSGEVVEEVLHNLEASMQESCARVTFDGLPTVSADRTQLAQVFQNLIGNAIKFRGPQLPEIHVGAEPENGMWVFRIADNGIGFDPEQEERIFQIFQRLHERAKYNGSGIGLAIVKKIIEQHGGRVWAQSEPGAGASFYFTLPDSPAGVSK